MIAYLRSQFCAEVVPDWVGVMEDGKYLEILEAAGLDISGAMDAAADDSASAAAGDDGALPGGLMSQHTPYSVVGGSKRKSRHKQTH